MKHRLFIAINLPEELKVKLEKKAEIFSKKIPARWLTPENWHQTISFLGYQPEEDIIKIKSAIQKTAHNFIKPLIEVNNIAYGPIGSKPRMVWTIFKKQTSQNIQKIKDFLEDELENENINFTRERRPFFSHLTLARFQNDFSIKNYPPLNERFFYAFSAKTLDLMESILKREGASYNLLASYPFNEK